jgi:undecaprenyl-diphosphatase
LGGHLTWGILAGALLLLIFAKLAEDVLYQELETFDAAAGAVIRNFASDGLTRVMIFITELGSAYVEFALLVTIGGFLWVRLKHAWDTLLLVVSLLGGWVLNMVLKTIFQRSRPDIEHLVEAGGYSFPSGHAMVSAAFYGMIGYIVWVNLYHRGLPAWPAVLLTPLLILAIGVSRVYLGVHFASDVLAGFAAGGVWLIACIIGLRQVRKRIQ